VSESKKRIMTTRPTGGIRVVFSNPEGSVCQKLEFEWWMKFTAKAPGEDREEKLGDGRRQKERQG